MSAQGSEKRETTVAAGESPTDEDFWAPIPIEPPPSLASRVLRRPRRLALGGLSGVLLIALVTAVLLAIGERQTRREAEKDLGRARAQLVVAEADRADALRRAARASEIAGGLGERGEALSDVARRLESGLREQLAQEDLAVKALNDASAALSFGNTEAANEAIRRLNASIAEQQRRLTDIRRLLDEFDGRRAELDAEARAS